MLIDLAVQRFAFASNNHRHQANRVIIDSIRIKGMPDAVVERELRKLSQSMGSLRSLKFVTKKRTVIDIL